MTDNALRVLLVCDFVPPVIGGAEFHVMSLATVLTDLGHTVAIATLTEQPVVADERVLFYRVRATNKLLPHAGKDRPFPAPLFDPLARHAFSGILRDFAPDVVHAHSWLAQSIPHPRIPLVVTAHDYAPVCLLRTLYNTSAVQCSGPALGKCIACASPALGRTKATMLALATAYSARRLHPARWIAVSRSVATAIEDVLAVPVDVISNFTTDVDAEAVTLPAQPFIMYAGHPGPHKGVDDLLELWGQRPDYPRLLLATTVPFTEDRLPLPANVTSVGMRRGQVQTAWRSALFAVAPSRWAEPCPTAVIEAMACGTAVIASRTGGITDLIDDGVDGLLFDPGDVAALDAHIKYLLDDPDKRNEIAAAARRRARAYHAALVVPRIAAVYRQAIVEQAAS